MDVEGTHEMTLLLFSALVTWIVLVPGVVVGLRLRAATRREPGGGQILTLDSRVRRGVLPSPGRN